MDASTAILITLAFSANLNITLDINELIDQLKKSKPVVPQDININVSDEIKVSDDLSVTVGSSRLTGSLTMVKTTNSPSKKELELVQAARGNRPYNSITDVRISYDENGNITLLQWSES